MGKASRDKGKRGEREFAELLRSLGCQASRGAQHRGGPDSPDIVCPELGGVYHFEVKRSEKLSAYAALEQAAIDAPSKIPVVAHRSNGRPWIVILPAEHLIRLLIERRGPESAPPVHYEPYAPYKPGETP